MTLSEQMPNTTAEVPTSHGRRTTRSFPVLLSVLVLPCFALLSLWCAQQGWIYYGGWGAPVKPTRALQEIAFWHAVLMLGGGWLVLTPLTALSRWWRFHQPVDVGREFTRSALLMTVLGIALGLLLALTRFTQHELLGVYAAVLIRCIYGVPVLRLILAIFQRHPGPHSEGASPWIVRCWSTWRLRLAHRAGGLFLSVVSLVLIGAGIWIGVASTMNPFQLPADTILRVLVLLASLLVWVSLVSGLTGVLRIQQVDDVLGLKTSVLALLMTLAGWAVLFIVLFWLPAHATWWSVRWPLRYISQPGVALLCFADLALLLIGLTMVPTGAKSVAADGDQTVSHQPPATPLMPTDRVTPFFIAVGTLTRADIMRAFTCLWHPWRFASLDRTDLPDAEVHGGPLAIRMVGWGALVIGVAWHAVAMVRLPETPLLHFMRTGFIGFDLLSRLAAILVLLMILLIGLYVWGRIMHWPTTLSGLVALVGFAQLPFACLSFVTAYLPVANRPMLSLLIGYPMLCWAGMYLLLNLACYAVSRFRLAISLLGAMVVLLVLTMLGRGVAQTAHLEALRLAGYPVTILLEHLSEEAPPSQRQMVTLVMRSLSNPDVVAIRAADLIEHVAYQSKVQQQYYPPDQYPQDIVRIRIHAELTDNARWMRRLYLPMKRVTWGAKTPAEAVKPVTQWLTTVVTEIEPMVFPLGEKCDQDPITTLTCRRGTEVDAAILLVAALRAAGVAARMRPVWPDEYVNRTYALVEYYDGKQWLPCYPTTRQRPKTIRTADRIALQQWSQQAPAGTPVSLYMLIDGLWRPYSIQGSNNASTFRVDLQPGCYLAAYRVGDVCHVKQFRLQSAEPEDSNNSDDQSDK